MSALAAGRFGPLLASSGPLLAALTGGLGRIARAQFRLRSASDRRPVGSAFERLLDPLMTPCVNQGARSWADR